MQNLVKVNIFLTDKANFARVNEVYDEFVTWQPKPVGLSSVELPTFRDYDPNTIHRISAVLALQSISFLLELTLKLNVQLSFMRNDDK